MTLIQLIKYLAVAGVFLAVYLFISQWALAPSGRVLSPWREGWSRLSRRFLNPIKPAGQSAQEGKSRRLAYLGLLAGLIAGYVLFGSAGNSLSGLFWALLLGGAGYSLPRVLTWVNQRQRRTRMTLQLPDALEIIGNSLRAGLSLIQALEVVSQETARPLADEFSEVVRDCRLGLPPEDALEKMLRRWSHPDLELFVIAAGVSLRTGGNLAEVTARITATVRERFRLQGRIESLTAQGKLSGWIVGLLPLGLLVALIFLDPPLMANFFSHPLGWLILTGGLIMELIGAFFIFKIVSIDV